MKSRSGNIPLTHLQMELLPMGFTPTNTNVFGMTGQQLKKFGRTARFPHTNRKASDGRQLQVVKVYQRNMEDNSLVLDENGKRILVGWRQIWHKVYTR
jgi:hypothetical protein